MMRKLPSAFVVSFFYEWIVLVVIAINLILMASFLRGLKGCQASSHETQSMFVAKATLGKLRKMSSDVNEYRLEN